MTEIKTGVDGLRAVTTDNLYVYCTSVSSPSIYVLKEDGTVIECVKAPCKIGALKYHAGCFYAGSIASAKPCIYKLNEKLKPVKRISYLKNVPPKYLPEPPYEKYVAAIAINGENMYVNLQNGEFILVFDQGGNFIGAEKGGKDVAGIDFYKQLLLTADMVSGIIRLGGKPIVSLPDGFHPFGIEYRYGKIFAASATSDKIAIISLR